MRNVTQPIGCPVENARSSDLQKLFARHSCATLSLAALSLAANVPVHVVAKRLGHASAVMTLDVYGHALRSMEQDWANSEGDGQGQGPFRKCRSRIAND